MRFTLDTPGGAFRVGAQRLEVDGVGYLLAGRYPLREVEQTMEEIRRMFSVAIPLLILAAAVSGYVLARRSLAPVASMAEHATAISATTLHERLPVGGGDELVRLARVINDLLNRLEQSFEQQRRFMADASHELRTPTAIVRAEADVTLAKPHREEAEYRESMGIMQAASRRLTRIVDDLFLLARSDAGHLVVHRAPIHLEDVVDDTTRGMRPLADTRRVRLALTNMVEAPVDGDADLLGRLLLNLFERFFRLDAARTREETSHTSGAGLGLAIARRIAEAHDGALALAESRPGRTTFRLTLPLRLRDSQRG